MSSHTSQHDTTKSIVRQLYRLADARQRRMFWLLCVLNVLMGLFEIAVAGGVSLLGVAMSAPQSLSTVPLLEALRSALPLPEHLPVVLQFLLLLLAGVCLATLLKNLLLAWITRLQNMFAQGIAWHVGTAMFCRLLAAPYTWHCSQNSADLLTTLNWKVYAAQYLLSLLVIFTQTIIAVFLLSTALLANPLVTLLLFTSIAVLGLVTQKLCQARVYQLSDALRGYDLHNARVAMQGLHGLREIVLYDQTYSFAAAYQKYVTPYIRAYSLRAIFPSLPQWILESTGMFLLLFSLLLLMQLGASVAETTGLLVLLAAVSWRLLPAANKIMGAVMNMRVYQPNLEKVLHLLRSLPARSLPQRADRPFLKEIRLENVTFRYPGAERPALDNVSLVIPRGSMVGIVGQSGAGKSTLTGVLTGLLQPESGSLLVDGKPFDHSTERLKIGYVPQNLYLLDATLAENVAFSQWGKPVDEARVRECCRMAAMDFVDDLPQGIHTRLGERGVRLSGGQVQRVAIARALYDEPDVLVFDEATSSLDSASEQAVQSTINNLSGYITMIVVAHRLNTVQKCNIACWIDIGTVKMHRTTDIIIPVYEIFLQNIKK